MEIKTKYTDNVIAGSGYLAPNKKNPHLETLGLYYDFGSSQAVEAICSQLGASPYQSWEIVSGWREIFWRGGLSCLGLTSITSLLNPLDLLELNHTDSGFLTILQADANVGGLEVMDKSGAFVPVHPCPVTLLVNFGHLAKVNYPKLCYYMHVVVVGVGIYNEAWSNGRLCNVKHIVQCREAAVHISIASFLFGPKEEALEAPPEFVDSEHPRLYVPFLSEENRKLRLSASLCGEALELLLIKS
ncbi:hypothetical protein ACLB2K_050314 [Fragaria x ananassa]